ncbi:hypothetical protein PR048_008037 [Dryococelus australis]|uniref:Uncharacterized protein n=1 Tax=Dryococelus australis TaxID=614101 RepID=A0ABQ9HWS1_9NEOP|nr:hypothetical protein PR048_008037 [Dryococelus australis]
MQARRRAARQPDGRCPLFKGFPERGVRRQQACLPVPSRAEVVPPPMRRAAALSTEQRNCAEGVSEPERSSPAELGGRGAVQSRQRGTLQGLGRTPRPADQYLTSVASARPPSTPTAIRRPVDVSTARSPSCTCGEGTTVAEWLAYSPPFKANRIQSPRPGHRIFASVNRAGRCRWSAGFLGDLPFPPAPSFRCRSISLQSPSSAIKTSVIRSRSNFFTHLRRTEYGQPPSLATLSHIATPILIARAQPPKSTNLSSPEGIAQLHLTLISGADSADPRRNRRPTSSSPLHETMRSWLSPPLLGIPRMPTVTRLTGVTDLLSPARVSDTFSDDARMFC